MQYKVFFLRECFHKDVHERLSALITSWYPCLKNVDTEANPLEITDFEFDKDKTTSLRIYMDLIELIEKRALVVPVTGDVRGRFCGRCLSADLGKSKEIIRPKSK